MEHAAVPGPEPVGVTGAGLHPPMGKGSLILLSIDSETMRVPGALHPREP